ncbi:Cyclic nucleotide-gated cation channel subunit A (Cyclic nucleotide-gated ion channel subunit A) (CNG channel) [Durusdinium trenchii]|uniref:Cyclic nucleotide-gated cation channel subunit A (Cyclic nucleotide-gated ion channel subunit A) (CNG channel) n=1 Tax=Durusdinium trenchii TaxID=1381693 RepID=A0ABP0PFK0_9DINO
MAACVFYDLLVIPLYAFTLPRSVLWDVLDWLIQIYWNLDFAVSFLTGFYDEGTLVFSLLRIAMHYAKTWMLFDLSLISMDWAFRAMEWSNESELQNIMWSRSLRMLRFLRLMRMLRMVKLRRINEVFQEFFTSQASTLYYSLFSSLIHLCVLNHLVACAWFAVSHVHSENWVTDLGLQDDSMEYQYLTCLNWAFAQLGVGSSPAKATNVVEMAYCIFVAFRSLITSSTLISTVSNLMAGLSKIKEDENTEFRLLRCYMSQNNISAQLAQKITHFLQYQWPVWPLRRAQWVHLEAASEADLLGKLLGYFGTVVVVESADMDVPLLELLSPQLHGELQFARFEKELCKLQVVHDLVFEGADRQVVHILQRVSQDAVKNNVVAAADVIFLAGNHAASAYLKLSGDLTYCYERP